MEKARKINRRILVTILLVTLLAPFVIIIRLLRPVWLIRFGYFSVDRIGHLAFDVEIYLAQQSLGRQQTRTLDIFFLKGKESNLYLVQMVRRRICAHPIVQYLYRANDLIPFGGKHKLLPARETANSRDFTKTLNRTYPQMAFTDKDNLAGRWFFQKLGLKAEEKIVVLMVRDSAYLESLHQGRDWSYHDCRDTDINAYQEMSIELANRDYWVFRMGKVVDQTLTLDHPRVIDYANLDDRSDFLDIWLIANCHFAVSTGLGLGSVADIFRKPKVFVNYLPILDLEGWSPSITVPKHLVWTESQRPLTLKEQLQHTSLNGHYYKEMGISIVDLTQREITEAVLEMEAA